MLKIVGWMIVVAAASLIYSLAFTPFSHMVGYESSGSGSYVRKYIECPAPLSVLLCEARPSTEAQPGACVPPSRTLTLEAGIVAIAAVALAWTPLRRPRPRSIEPLSDRINPSGPRRD